ncbi:MAG: hypothetical protein Q9165_008777 [Trypethelium subeluteriae]
MSGTPTQEQLKEVRDILDRQDFVRKTALAFYGTASPEPGYREAVEIVKAERRSAKTEAEVDHSAVRVARAVDCNTGEIQSIDVREDTGSVENWISPKVLERLMFQRFGVDKSMKFVGLMGIEYTPEITIETTLTGRGNKSLYVKCFVAPPEFPVEGIVLGTNFIKTCGHPHTHFSLKEQGQSLIVVQRKIGESERLSIEQDRAETEKKAAESARQKQQQISEASNAAEGAGKDTAEGAGKDKAEKK